MARKEVPDRDPLAHTVDRSSISVATTTL